MAAEPFVDLETLDLSQTVVDKEQIQSRNPQRGDMHHLDGIVWHNDEMSLVVGYKDVRDDEFWVEGHIPGRPLLPGVLMIEAAAQLAGYVISVRTEGGEDKFFGFVGVEDCRFRGQVIPGQRLYLIGKEIKFKSRKKSCAVQGFVEGKLVFEATVLAMVF